MFARIDKYKRPIVIHGIADEKTDHIRQTCFGAKDRRKSKKFKGGGRIRPMRPNFPTVNSIYQPVCCF